MATTTVLNPATQAELVRKKSLGIQPTDPANIASYNALPSPAASPAPGSTQSAQAWINNPASGQGGTANYQMSQAAKLQAAQTSGNTDMINRLKADSQRTGLDYSGGLKSTGSDAPVTGPPSPAATSAGTQPMNNGNASLINQQYDANYASQLQKLQKTRDIQQQGLNQQETGVNQNALQNLNNNDATSAMQLKKLQEVQANNGVNGGDSITATIGNQTAQQQGANSINQDRANQLNNIQQQRSLINNNASADDLALMQQLQGTKSGQLIDDNNTQQQRSLQLAMLMGKTADGTQTLGGNQLALQQQGQNFTQGLQTQQFGMQQNNQNFNQNLQTNQFGLQQQNQNFTQGMDQQKLQQAGQQFAQTMGLNYAQLNVQQQNILGQLAIGQQNANTNATQASNSYDLGLKNNAVSQQNADNQGNQIDNNKNLDQQKIDWSKDPNNPYNQKNTSLSAKYDAQGNLIANSVTPDDSTNNYNDAINQMQGKSGLTKAQATTYAQSIQPHMTDSDYRKLNDYIQKNY